MFAEIIVGGGVLLWYQKKQKSPSSLADTLSPTCTTPKNRLGKIPRLKLSRSTSGRAGGRANAVRKFSLARLVKDVNQALNTEGRQQLQLDIDPELRKAAEENRKKSQQQLVLSGIATGVALLSTFYPILVLPGVIGVIYLSRDWIYLAWKDIKRRHFFSLSVFGIVMMLGTLATGNLFLSALGAFIGSGFAKVINRLEESSQQQLVRIFGGHPERVWLLRDDGTEIEVDFHAIQLGDTVVVNAGEVIPADGCIQSGEGQVDQHLLTGESQPVEKTVGEPVFASTVLLSGRLAIKVETAGNDTVAAKIGSVLSNTQSYKDSLINRGRQTADRFLPLTAALGLASLYFLGPTSAIAVLWSSLGGLMGLLGPLSVLSYLQILSRNHILIKDGRVFESLRQVDTIVFDKTGTLTEEQPTVARVHALGDFDEASVLRYAAAAEYRQSHPIAHAILDKARAAQLNIPVPDAAGYEVGYGIKVSVEGQTVRVGSARFLQREEIALPEAVVQDIQQQAEAHGYSLIYVSVNGQLAGILEMQPTIRPETAKMIQHMKQRGMALCIISGDHKGATEQMAKTLGIDRYFAEVLPENKADLVQQLRDEGRFVCFIGDGINDAIALKSAHVSISLKGASSAATDTAQIVFMDGSLQQLEPLFRYADEFEGNMKRNLAISIVPGSITIAGVFLLQFQIATAMVIFYIGLILGLGNVLWPLVEHQDVLAEEKEIEASTARLKE